jgi:hypothetical protein
MYPLGPVAHKPEASAMNIFDSHGRIDTGVDPATIPEDQRPQYDALVAAQIAGEAAETAEKIANDKVAECVRTYNTAVARIPKQTHTALVKEALGLV